VRSQSGVGSSFTLCFPLAAGGAIPVVAARPVTLAVAGQGQRVMYVDDDQALVFLVDRALSRKGYVVSGFTDPLAALEALRERPLAFDLLVSDYNMPGFCGLELLREARQIRPSLPVALASGFVTADIEQSALAEGARALIHKPNDVEELCETVQRLLQGGGS
ncbi:MAG: response regulator, partial [Betaproteobacteria bacterium]|nr:response regulator [Betaproteobacteria bacterium]